MKKVLFILGLALCSCSTDSPTADVPEQEEQVIQYGYFMSLEDECLSGNDTQYEITADMYKSVYNMHSIDDCSTYHRIPDIDDVWREGYLSDLTTDDPEY